MYVNFSFEQEEIVFSSFNDIALVMAYAGTGKSFTLKHFIKNKPFATFLYFVYNASMRKDAEKSFKGITNVKSTTFHGIAFAGEGKEYQVRLDKEEELKAFDLVRFITRKDIDPEAKSYYAHILLKVLRDFTASAENIKEYKNKHKRRFTLGDIQDQDALAYALGKLSIVWEEIIQKGKQTLPFEHDFYLKLFQLAKYKLNYDYILVDEAQDISPVMMDIVLRQKSSKKIFVGDSFQQIYSWRGAINSLDYIRQHFSPSVYFLSQSFRCPPKVAWLANMVIQKAGATKEFVGVASPAPITKQTTYIARTNGGLFGFCAENIDKKIYFVGGIRGYNFSDLLDIQNLISNKHEFIRNDFIASFPDFKSLLKYSKEMKDVSLIGTIGIVLKYMKHNIYSLVKELKEAATTNIKEADIVVTTAHKSKGLEWSQVELLDDFPFSSEEKMARCDMGEELRLLYVSITRAMGSVKLPESILEFLEMDGMNSEYKGTASLGMMEEQGEEVTGIGGEDKVLLAPCVICGNGEVYHHGSKVFCVSCDFSLKINRVSGFFSNFKKEVSQEESIAVLEEILTSGTHSAKGLISKKGRPFKKDIIVKKDATYGWGLSFLT